METPPDQPAPKPLFSTEHSKSDTIRQLVADGTWPRTVAGQQELATNLGCSFQLVRKVLRDLNVIGGDPRGHHKRKPSARRPFTKRPTQPADSLPDLAEAEAALDARLRDARDPATRLDLLNALATNQQGDVPASVQHAALKTIAEEQRMAGAGFGPPPPSTPDEEVARILSVLRSATQSSLTTAMSILGAETATSAVVSSQPLLEEPHEPEAGPLEAPPDPALP